MRYELKKMIFRKEVLILSGLALVFLGICIARFETPKLAKMYREEMKRYDGEYTEIRQQLEADYQEAMKAENAGVTGTTEYYRSAVLSNLFGCGDQYDRYFEERRQMLKELQKKIGTAPIAYIKADFEKAYQAYNCAYSFRVINVNGVQITFLQMEEDSFDYIFLVFLLAFFCGLFVSERETKMDLLLYPSKKGKRKLFWNKIGGAVLTLAMTSVFFTVVPFFGTWIRNMLPLSLLWEPVQCVQRFEMCPYSISIFGYLLVSVGMHFLVGLLVLAVITLCSVWTKKSLVVFAVAGLPVMGLSVLGKSEALAEVTKALDKLGCLQLLDEWKYFISYDTVNVAGMPVTRIVPALAFTGVLATVLLFLAYGGYVGLFRRGGR